MWKKGISLTKYITLENYMQATFYKFREQDLPSVVTVIDFTSTHTASARSVLLDWMKPRASRS